MSLVTEILDRLTGIAAVSARLDQLATRIEKAGAWLLDHEKRIIRLEERAGVRPHAPPGSGRALPKR